MFRLARTVTRMQPTTVSRSFSMLSSKYSSGNASAAVPPASATLDHGGTYDDSFDKYSIQDSQQDSTGRARAYVLLGGGKAVYSSIARLSVMKLVATWSASADVLALGTIEVDTSGMAEGTSLVTKWRGKPVFIRHRTQKEVDQMKAVDISSLRDPETDAQRTKPENDKWLVVVGVCTHLGCVPMDDSGDFNAYFCPCHGSHYDRSGRIRKGPAPLNLEVPEWKFLDPKTILLGS